MPIPPDAQILEAVRDLLPAVRGVYVFGSHAVGAATPESDLDIAVLARGRIEPRALWAARLGLIERLDTDVDLVDLAAAPTTLQYEIVSKGRRLQATDDAVDDFELFVLTEGRDFDVRREPLIREIIARGSVYG